MLSAILFFLTSSSVMAAEPPKAEVHILTRPCEFDQKYQFSDFECSIELENPGDRPVRISDAEAVRSGDTISPTEVVVPAKGVAYLKTRVSTRDSEGYTRFHFRFRTDQFGGNQRTAEVKGYVLGILDQHKPTIDFGLVDADQGRPASKLTLSSREMDGFRLTSVKSKPDYLDVTIDGLTLTARLNEKAPLGILPNDHIELSVNHPSQDRVWVTVKGRLRGDVAPDSDPFELGLMRTNATNEALIRLSSRSGKPFKIGSIAVDRIKATAEAKECTPASDGCRLIKLSVSNDQRKGQIGGIVRVELPDSKQVLPIQVWGMLLSPEVEVIDLHDEAKKQSDASTQSVVPPQADLKSALKLATRKDARDLAAAVPAGDGPLIKWSVDYDDVVFAYAVYRSKSESGPFVRVNKSLIPANTKENSGTPYQWRDTSAVPGETYWYYIGMMYRDGKKEILSKPQKKAAS